MPRNRWIGASGIAVMVYAVLSFVTTAIFGYLSLQETFMAYRTINGDNLPFVHTVVELVLDILIIAGYSGLGQVQTTPLGRIGGWLLVGGAVVAFGASTAPSVFIATNNTHELLAFIRSWWFTLIEVVALFGPFVGLILSGIATVRGRILGRWSFTPLLLLGWFVVSYGLSVLTVVLAAQQLGGSSSIRTYETTVYLFNLITAVIGGVVWFLFGYGLLARRAPLLVVPTADG